MPLFDNQFDTQPNVQSDGRFVIRQQWQVLRAIALGIGTSLLTLWVNPGKLAAIAPITSPIAITDIATHIAATNSNDDPVQLVQSGKGFYQSGQYAAAVTVWQQAMQGFAGWGDRLNQAVVLSNLALAYQQLGQWPEANQAIADSLRLLQGQESATNSATGQPGAQADGLKLLAQALNIQGSLQLAQGQSEQALVTWQSATNAYQKTGDSSGAIRSLINQTQAFRALGLYPRAKSTLEQVHQMLQAQPDSLLKAAGLLNYGDALRLVGDLAGSEKVLKQSLAIAQRLQSPADITPALLSLGNTARAQQQPSEALGYYQQAMTTLPNSGIAIQAQLNQLRLLTEMARWPEAQTLISQIQPQFDQVPASRIGVYARVNFAQNALKLQQATGQSASKALSGQDIAQVLATAVQQAKQIGDQRAESYAIGYLGEIYERTGQRADALALTERALLLAQANHASDIAYRWQWQLGRILNTQGNREKAIAAYNQAVATLESIRNDLVASSPDIQFSFRETVEPVYREFVALLLQPMPGQTETSQENLRRARKVIESLQLAELDNFFKEACLTGRPALVDQVDPKSAVVYPIILPNSLEIVLSIPKQPLRHYTVSMPQKELEQTMDRMRRSLRRSSFGKERLAIAQKVYDLLIRPAEADLAASGIQTLVFVLDGSMKNLPMATLHDGKQYLLEKYSVALTPGLQLLDPRPLPRQEFKVLVGALSEGRQGFTALPGVETEINQIQRQVPSRVLFNQTFTTSGFQQQVSTVPFRVVHLATHGQFSSSADDTFILTWDRRIDVKQLGELLQARDQEARIPIELLVLSACETAEGDRRAALGLAGIAVRSGARSTLATLWAVDDEATSQLMVLFYQNLAKSGTTKAEALRQAQLTLLKQAETRHPFYWAPFVLVGNWL
jgi:CHAT domain-containing protein